MAILERGVNKSTAQVLEPIIQDVYDRLQIDEGIDREIKNKPANLIHQAVSVGQGLNPTRPLEIVAIDHSMLPLLVDHWNMLVES
jgi:hypothetical protein